MAEKCALCGGKIENTFLDKLDGAIVKIKKVDKNEKFYVCSDCQKQHGRKLKEEVEKKIK